MNAQHIVRSRIPRHLRVQRSRGAGLRPRVRGWHPGVSLALTLMLTGIFFSLQGSAQQASPDASPSASPVMATPTGTAHAVTHIIAGDVTIEITDEGFIPETFASAVGRDIRITLKNSGSRPHNFTIEKLDIDINLKPGETRVVPLDAPNLGAYPYTSDLPGDEGISGIMTIFI